MKAITLTQPWASLVAFGEKRIETRGWPTSYRGPIAIHAAKGLADPIRNEDGLREWMLQEPFAAALARHGVTVAEQLPRGAIVAVAELVDCLGIPSQLANAIRSRGRTLGDVFAGPAEHERAFGDYSDGRFAFILGDVKAVDPAVPYRGAQGLFEIPDDVVSATRLDVG